MTTPYFHRLGQVKWLTKKKSEGYKAVPIDPDEALSNERNHDGGILEKGSRFTTRINRLRRPVWSTCQVLVTVTTLMAAYTLFIFLIIDGAGGGSRRSGMPFSPASNVLTFADTIFALEDHITEGASQFSGMPSDEVDKAWHDLLSDENILLEPEYIRHYGREDTSVEVPEGGHYIGTMNVFHELHCLKRIKQFMYSDYYFPNISEHEKEINRLHNEHCIDFLRQSAMCHGDIGLITYSWHAEHLLPIANATSHQCVNWEKLSKWTHDRTVDMMKPGWLMHPTKGAAYPDGEGDPIGAAESHGHRRGL